MLARRIIKPITTGLATCYTMNTDWRRWCNATSNLNYYQCGIETVQRKLDQLSQPAVEETRRTITSEEILQGRALVFERMLRTA